VGQSLSLAIHPLTKIPYISYYDGANADLKLAFPVSSGGDCGPGSSWSCNSLKHPNTESYGSSSSIDINSAGDWGISYVKNSSGSSVNFDGTLSPGNTQFYTSVDSLKYSAYYDTSFRFNPDGNGSFAYLGIDSGAKVYVNFASYTASLNNSCGSYTFWSCETVAQVSGIRFSGYPSLAYWGYLPLIAYRGSDGRLYFAARTASGTGSCPYSAQWECTLVDKISAVVGGISFDFRPTDSAIAYYDSTTHYMVVASGTTGVCNWTCSYIENVGAQDDSSNDGNEIAIAFRNGKYLVAYTDRKNPNNTILKVAYPDPNGNCGPVLGGKPSWRCEVVDDGGGTKSVGKFISMGVTPSNVVYIAYSNDTDGTLKLAYQDLNLFLPIARK
jgi:hypothetical protein